MKNPGIELFRALCMFGVVLIHTTTFTDYPSPRIWCLASPSVVGFIIISGWFGIKLRWSKIIRLIVCVLFVAAEMWALLTSDCMGYVSLCKSYWFVWAYIFIMMLSPIVDGFVENCKSQEKLLGALIPLGLLLFGWSFTGHSACVQKHFPLISGFGDISGLILFLIYAFTRILKEVRWFDELKNRPLPLIVIMVAAVPFVLIGLRHNDSIFAYVYAISLFSLLMKFKVPVFCRKLLRLVGPSLFCVYLLHWPCVIYFADWERYLHATIGGPHVVCQIILAILVFFACLVVDMPRRMIVLGLRKVLNENFTRNSRN